MVGHGYSAQYDPEKQARAIGVDLNISVKHAVNVCNMIRSRALAQAKTMLEEVIAEKRVVPYRRYKKDLAHKKGNMTAGRTPVKTTKEILMIIKSAEANAINKGFNASSLVISHISVQKAANQWHYGRSRGRVMKRAHLEIVLEEASKKADDKDVKKKTPANDKPEVKKADTEKKNDNKPNKTGDDKK
ncbi:50S ribosomal protein L22 [Candidatus Woesearchaeota archaeon CG11_big_fil_rev_8_21_14_0_20_43_8]|nr:MAG: 50S ribosomal protein L22 [Candidatus Woesearchaeota archaeon CG11_big_fil_rev_8_21_14_0_20_43_8]PIO05281.1 MAG: 50S ribosomal protein L22 [Candidatus Woesearchaeota archaeon CG08_land_8_20_14_0_20_43_7]